MNVVATLLSLSFLISIAGPSAGGSTAPGRLSFEDRVRAREAVERVYARHRIAPGPKGELRPAMEAEIPASVVRAKVADALAKSGLLASRFGLAIGHRELQGEIDRMARDTRSPEVLRELFEALGNDPFLIAETLARPVLAERWVRDRFGSDPPILEASREGAELDVVREEYKLPAIGAPRTDDTWSPIASSLPDPMNRHAAVWTGAEMLVWGGTADRTGGGTESAAGHRYDPATDTWRRMSPAGAPTPRYGHTAVWTGTEMIVWGGYNSVEQTVRTGARYDPVSDTWVPTSMMGAPQRRWLHTAVWTGSAMIVFGGDTGIPGALAARYDPTTDTWTAISTAGAPVGRRDHTAVWTGSRMIVWGGNPTNDTQTGAIYDPVGDTWASTATAGAPAPRYEHTAIWTGTRMIVWGGQTANASNDGGRYDPDTNAWSPTGVGANVPSGRVRHTAVWTGSEMIVWGGSGAQGSNRNDGGRYDPAFDTWQPIGVTGAPPPRDRHSAVWTGIEMIVFGGRTSLGSGGVATRGGGRYRPDTNTWTPTSVNVSAPDPRQAHTAVWTGAEWIVWGGWAPNLPTLFASGGRYDPALDLWTPTATAGAPSGRFGHVAVWTGSRMIVWGGTSNTGGRYDPVADSWQPTAVSGAPSGTGATAVWTGSRMIVWGGDFNTGGRYDPEANTWTATSTTGAPTGRRNPSAIWTGAQMVVWGGNGLATGGRYDPVLNSWTATSTVGAPAGRDFHTAVWDGTRMIVWGGNAGSGTGPVLDTGGRYDPVSDQWTAMSASTGVVAARKRHDAVWTGQSMVVWGGGSGSQGTLLSLGTGGRYDPVGDAWVPTAVDADAPDPRNEATMSRAGNLILAWGGDALTATGAAYCLGPCTPDPYYRDADGDGYGTVLDSVSACDPPAGYVEVRGDCDDGNAAVKPSAVEVCNLVDDDCDAGVDEGFDLDADTFATCEGDCDDTRAAVYPGAPQLCDGLENDCSLPTWPAVPANESNADGDGFRICAGDCDDTRSAVFPGAPQLCDGINNDCSDPNWPAVAAVEADADLDGYRICQNDCNDAAPGVNPGATEVCNGVDDDCDGPFDEDADGTDSDGDGVRNLCDNCRFAANPTQIDSDGDDFGNACDNCLSRANPDQADADADARGNVCDNCPLAFNPLQDDSDADTVGDACDNCLFEANPSQSDVDADNEGDLCDTDDGLIYIVSTDENYVEWQQESGPGAWNVYEGDLAVLKGTGVYTQLPGSNPLADRHCGLTDPFVEDLEVPDPGGVKCSLVTGVTAGVEGALGADSEGTPRPNTNPCP